MGQVRLGIFYPATRLDSERRHEVTQGIHVGYSFPTGRLSLQSDANGFLHQVLIHGISSGLQLDGLVSTWSVFLHVGMI